ncbi:MAG TPA: 30S ribosomal protein S18 [Thermodesulfobacteriota bacterium]|nr:30S ribosomal protein S18 [Thermodesulfobacteriota bacterium]
MVSPKYYETLYLLRPDLTEDELNKIQERLKGIVTNHQGEVLKSEKWAERNIAYRIGNYSKGVYYVLVYDALPGAVAEIERNLRLLSSDVLRFMTVKVKKDTVLRTIRAKDEAALQEKAVSDTGTDEREAEGKEKSKEIFVKKKVGRFHIEATEAVEIDYKNVDLLSQFITERKKIVPRRSSGLTAFGQRRLATAIKRARIMALLPFTVLHD